MDFRILLKGLSSPRPSLTSEINDDITKSSFSYFFNNKTGYSVKNSVVDSNSLNLDPDPEFWLNLSGSRVLFISFEKNNIIFLLEKQSLNDLCL